MRFWFFLLCALSNFAIAQNFITYSVEAGLAQSQVNSIWQDRSGYLWLGTYGGGVSRFDGSRFKTFGVVDGLPDNTVYSICEDKNGNLWFGTYNGMSKFDGSTFTNYSIKDGLPNKHIFRIIKDRNHVIWIGTGVGVSRLDGSTFTNYNDKDGLTGGAVHAILEDKDGQMWFGTEKSGVFRYDGSRFIQIAGESELGDNYVNCLAQDSIGIIWIGTYAGGLASYDGKKFNRYPQFSSTVWAVLTDRDNHMWIGTRDGLIHYDYKTHVTYTMDNGLGNNSVWSILKDREGNIWAGTEGGGVSRFRDLGFEQYTIKRGLSDNVVWDIMEDKNNTIWIGTSSGLDRLDGNVVTHVPVVPGKATTYVFSVLQDSKNTIWIGTDGNGVYKMVGRNFIHQKVSKEFDKGSVLNIFEDRESNIWFGTYGDGVYKFDGSGYVHYTTKDGLLDDEVYSIFQCVNGSIWFIGASGVTKFDGKVFTNAFPEGPLSKGLVMGIAQGRDSVLWIGTDHGLYSLDGNDLTAFTENEGMFSNIIFSTMFDNDGNLWIGHHRGISKLDIPLYDSTGKLSISNYGAEEGLSGAECNQNGIMKDHLGNVWFGTIKGAVVCRPGRRSQNHLETLTHITGLRLFYETANLKPFCDSVDRATQLPMNLQLPHNRNHLSIDFLGINLAAPSRVRYQFKLDGLDEKWSPPTTDRKAVYPNLPPGEYTFHVKSCNEYGMWNAQSTNLSFVILPPFWRTWWFFVIGVLCFLGIGVAIIKVREMNMRSKAAELLSLNDKLRKEILSRIQTEAALRLSETNFRTFAEMLPAAIMVIRNNKIIYANPHTLKWSGCTVGELGGMNFWDMIHPDDKELVRTRGLGRQHGQQLPDRYEIKVLTKQKEVNWCDIIVRVIEYDSLPALLVAAIDITERKKTEEAILKARKIESLGILAGGIAHDFNNALTAIIGNISLAKASALKTDMPNLRDDLMRAEAASQMARSLTTQLLTFSKGGSPVKANTSIGDLLKETVAFVLSGSNVRVIFEISDDLNNIEADRGQISQVIQNVVLNAKQAMAEGGKLTIRAENTAEDTHIPGQQGDFVKISIHDEGVGMSDDTISRMFDPYFSTKATGSGLGLATSYSIIKNHGGSIYAESELGKGTSFYIYLPVSKNNDSFEQKADMGSISSNERILIMDDDENILSMASRMIESFGLEPISCKDVPSTVATYRSYKEAGKAFAVVIMDLTIPGGMGGQEAVKLILDCDPKAKVIVSSGYSEDPVTSNYASYGFVGVLPKPYNIDDLSKAIQDAMNRS